MPERRQRIRYARWCLGVLVAGAVLLFPIAVSTPVAADGIAQVTLRPGQTTAKPGGTFTVSVQIRSSPQIASGAYIAGVVIDYDPAYVRAVDIERGNFMGLQRNTTVRTNRSTIDNDAGRLIYELHRDPPKGGASGYATFAAITFEVREDAPAGTFEITVPATRVVLTDGMPQRTLTNPATVTINATDTATTTTASASPTPKATGTDVSDTPPETPADTGAGLRDGTAGIMGAVAVGGFVVGLLLVVIVVIQQG